VGSQKGERYDARRLKNVQKKLILAQRAAVDAYSLLFCGLFLAGRTSISYAEPLKAVQIDLVFRRRPLGAVMGSLVVCTWDRPL